MTGTDLCVNKPQSVLVIFEPPSIIINVRCLIVLFLFGVCPYCVMNALENYVWSVAFYRRV